MILPNVDPTLPIVSSQGVMNNQFRTFILMVSNLGVIPGSGSPEGVVKAKQTSLYMDEDGVTSILYIKQKSDIGGDESLGWVAI